MTDPIQFPSPFKVSRYSGKDEVMSTEIKRTYLMGYSHPQGQGRFFHTRTIDAAPTREDIESMEREVAANNGMEVIAIISVNLIANSKVTP